MTELVFDTSPLQAIWRSGHFDTIVGAFTLLLPRAVADETRHFVRAGTKAHLAPDLDAHPQILSVDVPRHDVDQAMRRFFGPLCTEVIQYRGEAFAWATRPGAKSATIGVPELEVVALAAMRPAVAVIDDHKALRVAAANGVLTATTRELLNELAARSLVPDLQGALALITATRYEPTTRRSTTPAFGPTGQSPAATTKIRRAAKH